MKKMIFILLIMTAFLASPVLANLLNPSFEYSIQSDPAGEADYWTWETPAGQFAPAGTIEYVTDDSAGAHTGNDYYRIRQNSQGWVVFYQDSGSEFPLNGLTELVMAAYFRTDNAPQGIAWKAEWYEGQGQSYGENVGVNEVAFDITSTDWQEYTHIFTTIPATANYVKFVIVAWNADWVYVDDCWIGGGDMYEGGTKPRLPQPENRSIHSVLNSPSYGYTPVTDLSWTNPSLVEDSTLSDPSQLGIQVKFGVGLPDPNFPSASTYSGTGIETVALSAMTPTPTLPLADDTSYYWQVIVTDANSAGPLVTEGTIWTFETGDALPIIQAPPGAYMWLSQTDSDGDSGIRTFSVTSTYTDDGKSAIVGNPNFSTFDWGWNPPSELGVRQVSTSHVADPDGPNGEHSGTVTEVYETVDDGTYATQIPGWWNFGLAVTDATNRTTTGPTGYYWIGETCANAADENPDDTFDTTYDSDGNCRIDTVDLATLCAKWLDESPKQE